MIDWALVATLVAGGLVANVMSSFVLTPKRYENNVPTFCLVIGVTVQLAVLPVEAALAWQEGVAAAGSSAAWLRSAWGDGGPRTWEHHFMATLVACMLKDIPWLLKYRHEPPHMGDLLIAHHVACCVIMLWGLADEPTAFAMFVATTAALEFGSAFSSLAEFWPRSAAVVWSFLVVMSASNAVASVFLVWFLLASPPGAWGVLMSVVGAVTLYFRQKVAFEFAFAFRRTGCANNAAHNVLKSE